MNRIGPTDKPALHAESTGPRGFQPSPVNPQPPNIPDHELLRRIGSGS